MLETYLERAEERERFTRTELAELVDRVPSTIDKHIAKRRITYDLVEGNRKWFSQAEVIRFLRTYFCATHRSAS